MISIPPIDADPARFAEALANVESRLHTEPAPDPAALAQLLQIAAVSALGLGQLDRAESYWRRAIEADPGFIDAYLHLNILLTALNRSADSESLLRQLVHARPGFADGYNDLGALLASLGRHAEAADAYKQALRTDPDRAEFHHNLGTVLPLLGQWSDSAEAYRRALALRPGLFVSANNLGNVLKELGQFAGSEAAYRQSLAIRADFAKAQFGLALLLLSQGRFEEGWQLYETRYADVDSVQHKTATMLGCSRWQGESLEGKRVLIWQEGGLGDAIQFSRYIALLKSLHAAEITFVCDTALHRLFSTLEGVDHVLSHNAGLAESSHYDYWTSLLSAPLRAQTTPDTIPPPAAFKHEQATFNLWRSRLSALPAGRRIGIVWKGNPRHQNDAKRSLPSLSALAPLWSVPGLCFVSLQTGPGQEEALAQPPDQPLLHVGSDLADMTDIAAIVAQLDLVISVDTSIVHLAGSVGTRCWVMLPAENVDWRWQHARDDSPWYPGTVRLFRQALGEQWSGIIEAVRQALLIF